MHPVLGALLHSGTKMAKIRPFNVFIYSVLSLGGLTYGFGFAGFTTSVGQPAFYMYFKLDRE